MWATHLNPSILEAEAGDLCEFKASLVCRVSSRTAKVTKKFKITKGLEKTKIARQW